MALVVWVVLSWGAGSWCLTKKSLAKIDGVQWAMIRRMLSFTALEHECAEEFKRRTHRIVRNTIAQHEVKVWSAKYHASVYKWAGHVSRIAKYDVSRITPVVMRWKNWAWIQLIASQNSGRQLHCRKLHTWRWERPLYTYFSDTNWEDNCQSKSDWQDVVEEFVQWRISHN